MHAAGRYFDGVSARSRDASIEATGSELVIRDADGRELARWRPADVRLVDPGVARADLRLKRAPPHQDRFIVGDAGTAGWLRERCRALNRSDVSRGALLRGVGWVGLAVLALVVFFEGLLPLLADRAAQALPPRLEAGLGEIAREQALRELAPRRSEAGALCRGGPGRQALERMVETLAAHTDPPLRIRADVVRSDVVNAFALPDGQVLLTRGLLQAAKHPDEVAGVVAHEIGHVAYRHPTAVALRQAGVAVILGALFGDTTGGSLLAGVAVHLVNTRYSREAEREADALGATLMDRAGYDRQGLADFLERIEREHPDPTRLLPFLSTHPQAQERRAAIAKRGDAKPLPPALDAEAWAAMQQICG